MSSIATCPQCAAQLAVPETASAGDQAQCPECRAEFSLAEGDLRYLSVAKIVEPIETPLPADSPAPTEPELEMPSPVEELSEISSPEPAQLADSLPETELPQDVRTAETILSPETLSGWEERLRTAIDSTETDSSSKPETADSPEAEQPSLENSPEFDFEMDPPAESPAESFAPAPTNLPETGEWFETNPGQTSEEVQAAGPTAVKRAAPPRRTKNSLLRRATVVVVFGAVGILLGRYALLWLRGPSADYLQIARFVPRAIFPSAQPQVFAPQIAAEDHFVSNDAPSEEPLDDEPAENLLAASEPVEREPVAPVEQPVVTRDDSVQQATVQLPEVRPSPKPSLLPSTNTNASDFEPLLATAHEAAQTLVDGNLSTKESFRAMGHAYMDLCQLAERFDFVHAANLDDDARSQALSAQALFRALSKRSAARSDLALIVSRWWQHERRPNQGIFLVGRIQDIEALGSHTLCQVAVVDAAESTLIPVLLPEATYRVGDQIGVVGTIVAQPRTVLPGFTADLPLLAVAADSCSVSAE